MKAMILNLEKNIFVCTKSIGDMGAPCITPRIQDSTIHHTTVLTRGA